jgi:hypothetical protein
MDRISRRQVVRGATAAAAMTLGAPSAHAQRDRQTLRFVAQADLKILDPVWTTAYITSYRVNDNIRNDVCPQRTRVKGPFPSCSTPPAHQRAQINAASRLRTAQGRMDTASLP